MWTNPWLKAKCAGALVVAVSCILLVLIASGQSPQPDVARDALQNGSLTKRIEALEAERAVHDSIMSSLSQLSPPIGSVIAFAGEWPPNKLDGTKWIEQDLGWMLCDGRPVNGPQYEGVRSVLGGSGKLPDYQGYFLRGLGKDGGVDAGRLIGSYQRDATALPKNSFITDADSGKHKHAGLWEAPGDDSKLPRWFHNDRDANFWRDNSSRKGIRPSLVDMQVMPVANGGHEHNISRGGDTETRPINVAVHWIIKVSAPQLR